MYLLIPFHTSYLHFDRLGAVLAEGIDGNASDLIKRRPSAAPQARILHANHHFIYSIKANDHEEITRFCFIALLRFSLFLCSMLTFYLLWFSKPLQYKTFAQEKPRIFLHCFAFLFSSSSCIFPVCRQNFLIMPRFFPSYRSCSFLTYLGSSCYHMSVF